MKKLAAILAMGIALAAPSVAQASPTVSITGNGDFGTLTQGGASPSRVYTVTNTGYDELQISTAPMSLVLLSVWWMTGASAILSTTRSS
jgi:hypothetical protein